MTSMSCLLWILPLVPTLVGLCMLLVRDRRLLHLLDVASSSAITALVLVIARSVMTDGPLRAAKLFAATMAKNVCDRSMQVLGGYGYVAESTVERLWRAAKLIEIGGGTLEAHHKNITRDLARDPGALLR